MHADTACNESHACPGSAYSLAGTAFLRTCLSILLILVCLSRTAFATTSLSLREAILLSLRNNPAVCQAKLDQVLQKFAIELQQWQFKPHYTLDAIHTTTRTSNADSSGTITTTQTGIQPGASWLTPFGTQFTLAATSDFSSGSHPGISLEILQPLLRGFGRSIVESALHDAIDQGKISSLNRQQVMRQTVTGVIHAWLDILLLEETIAIDRNMLAMANQSLKQTRLFIRAGRKPGVEEVSARAAVASAETTLSNDMTQQIAARHVLLMAIGLHPDTPIKLKHTDTDALTRRYHVPSVKVIKQHVLTHNPQYQIDQIILHGPTQRNLQQAEDQTRWQLNLSLVGSSGNGTEGGSISGFNSLINGVNQTSSVSLKLNIPIDDHAAKLAVSNAKIAIKQAEIALREEKWRLETDAVDVMNNVIHARAAIRLAAHSARLQEAARTISYRKYAAGLIDGLELQLAEQQSRSARQLEISNRIRYLHALSELDLLMGSTLKTWGIE